MYLKCILAQGREKFMREITINRISTVYPVCRVSGLTAICFDTIKGLGSKQLRLNERAITLLGRALKARA